MLIFKRFQPQDIDVTPATSDKKTAPISPEAVKNRFEGCGDFVSRTVAAGGSGAAVFVCWLDGTVDAAEVSDQVLRPLSDPTRFGTAHSEADVRSLLDAGAVYGCERRTVTDLAALGEAVSFGNCAAVFEGMAFLFQIKTAQRRTVQEPKIEKSVKGGKDSFTEALRVNTGLLRARLRTPDLKLTETVVGRRSRTAVNVLHIEGVAAPDVPRAVLARLEALDVDGLILPDELDSALSDAPRSVFPQVLHTERPDRLAAALLAGHTAVLADGMPLAFIVPASLPDLLRTAEDGAQHFVTASCLRLLRWGALGLTLLLPALYVAMSMFHGEMLPPQLLLSIIASKQSVPFSTTAEILGMLLAFERLQEAGLRLPAPVGQTVSIIGALIVGQSAVEARVISPIAVIVVAFSGIAGYTMPSQDLGAALRLCRFGLTCAGAAAGMFGVVIGTALLLWRVCSLESFGRAYVPAGREKPGDVSLRRPPWRDTLRSPALAGGNRRRRA